MSFSKGWDAICYDRFRFHCCFLYVLVVIPNGVVKNVELTVSIIIVKLTCLGNVMSIFFYNDSTKLS